MKPAPAVIPHLLLIDDDQEELDILSDALEVAGISCQCTWALGPLHGLKILQYFIPQFIFVDYNMPGLNGIECISEIRKTEAFSKVPVIFYSNNINDDIKAKARAAGAFSCIRKTADKNELANALKQLFARSELLRQLFPDLS